MPDSNITCSGLIAQGGVGQVALAWSVNDPNADGLPYLALDVVEVWAAAANDRASAVKIGEGATFALHAGVPEEQSRFYWIKARSKTGRYGEWFPVSATGGVQGTSTTATIVRAGLVEGGIIRTSASGRRIEIQGGGSSIQAFDESNGQIAYFGQATPADIVMVIGVSTNVAVARLTNNGAGPVFLLQSNRNACITADSSAFSTIQASNSAGGFAFYALLGGFGPFTGAHEGLWPSKAALPEIGDIVADRRIVFRNGISNTLAEMEIATQGGAPAIGVYAGIVDLTRTAAMPDGVTDELLAALSDRYRLAIVNSLGEGQINVCDAGGAIMAGDLLCASPIPGKAMRQSDDIVRSTTVARAREASDGRSQIACIYLAG